MIVTVIGAGLAGCEAAWQLAQKGHSVMLYEMKPDKKSPAHQMDGLAELVCSNSLGSFRLENATGLLKEELKRFGSLIMEAAEYTKVPAGGALAVDRENFSDFITNRIERHPNITLCHEEVRSISTKRPCIIATGPLTEGDLAEDISRLTGQPLFFYDAIAPIVTAESVDMDKAFRGARYDRGEGDYINCPMTKEEYYTFYEALLQAETAPVHGFEEKYVFEGCMPIESIAKRGPLTMAYGPLRPVGIIDERNDARPFAVVQLRQDDVAGSLYNLVGFQTRLKFPEQKRIFSMIPGLEHAEFVRYGVMHRNTYLNSPGKLNRGFGLVEDEDVFFAGQITGVEGYIPSTASGLTAALAMDRRLRNKEFIPLPEETVIGALSAYVTSPGIRELKPMGANFGLLPPLCSKVKKKQEKYRMMAERALTVLDDYISNQEDN